MCRRLFYLASVSPVEERESSSRRLTLGRTRQHPEPSDSATSASRMRRASWISLRAPSPSRKLAFFSANLRATLEGALRLMYAAMWIVAPTTLGEPWRSLYAASQHLSCRRPHCRRDLRGDAHQRARRPLRAVRAGSVHHDPL